jgi:hypothetical protein
MTCAQSDPPHIWSHSTSAIRITCVLNNGCTGLSAEKVRPKQAAALRERDKMKLRPRGLTCLIAAVGVNSPSPLS